MSTRTVYNAEVTTCDYCHREGVTRENDQPVDPPGWQECWWQINCGDAHLGGSYPILGVKR